MGRAPGSDLPARHPPAILGEGCSRDVDVAYTRPEQAVQFGGEAGRPGVVGRRHEIERLPVRAFGPLGPAGVAAGIPE